MAIGFKRPKVARSIGSDRAAWAPTSRAKAASKKAASGPQIAKPRKPGQGGASAGSWARKKPGRAEQAAKRIQSAAGAGGEMQKMAKRKPGRAEQAANRMQQMRKPRPKAARRASAGSAGSAPKRKSAWGGTSTGFRVKKRGR